MKMSSIISGWRSKTGPSCSKSHCCLAGGLDHGSCIVPFLGEVSIAKMLLDQSCPSWNPRG
jgi:hypothetical protein